MEIATIPCEEAAAAVELFIRSSLVLPRRPAILVLDAQADQEAKAPLGLLKRRNRRWGLIEPRAITTNRRTPPVVVKMSRETRAGNVLNVKRSSVRTTPVRCGRVGCVRDSVGRTRCFPPCNYSVAFFARPRHGGHGLGLRQNLPRSFSACFAW